MMYLLDTNVISELRTSKTRTPNVQVARWAENTPTEHLHLSVITILELEMGALHMERRDPAQGKPLRSWLYQQVMPLFAGRILPITAEIAIACAALHVPDKRSVTDALIAATALSHRMTVVTRNVSDFLPTGVPVINPWEA